MATYAQPSRGTLPHGRSNVWAFIVGEYPPQTGGVADYTWQVAHELSLAGDEVHVYAPPAQEPDEPSSILVHRLPDRYGPRGIVDLLASIRSLPESRRVVVQYVAQSFGMRALNFPLTLALLALRKPLFVMFHEFAMVDDKRSSIPRRAQALGTRWMATLAARAASNTFVSTPAWSHLVRSAAPHARIQWLPVPSNVPTRYDPAVAAAIRKRLSIGPSDPVVGHFGTYRLPEARAFLEAAIAPILEADAARRFLLVGRHGESFAKRLRERHPHLASRLLATGGLPPDLLAASLGACDVLVQPYAEGVTTRRGSIIAGLGLGLPTVSWTGPLTERFWESSNAVLLARNGDVTEMIRLVEMLLSDATLCARLGERARALYESFFAVSHTVDTLRAESVA